MRVSRTLIALAALLFATACTAGSPDVLTPESASASAGTLGPAPVTNGDSTTTANDAPADERGGVGMIGSGN
jgi:hypothetical protein